MALSKPEMDFSQMKPVTCPLCSEVYKSPKTLPCLHSFCEKCIHDFIISIGKTKGKDNKLTLFNCPVCRTVVRPNDPSLELVKWAESLPGNISVELAIAEAEGKKLLCILCKRLNRTEDATEFCCQCDELMCNNCAEIHCASRVARDHSVVLISDAGLATGGIYFNAIQGTRCLHHVQQYCIDHNELFCNVCTELKHKTCTKITALDDKATTDELCNTLPINLITLKDTVEKMVKERNEDKAGLRAHVHEIEDEVKEFVETVKIRLEDMFEAFRKELSVFHEEENTKINVRLRLLEQFAKTLEHWITVSSKLKGNATETQVLVLLETIKSQINASVIEIRSSLREETTLQLTFEKAKVLSEVRAVDRLGSLSERRENKVDQMDIIYKDCRKIGLFSFPSFEDVEAVHVKHIRVPNGKLRCGVSIDQHHALVGNVSDNRNLHIVNLSTGTVVNTTTFPGDVKRVCFDKDNKRVFISCYSAKLYTATVIDNKVSGPKKIAFNTDYVGGLCMIEKDVHVVVPGAIKSFDSDLKANTFRESIPTNTINRLNGLGTYDGHLIYTTKDNEVKCSNVTGKGIFCHKSQDIVSPQGLAILPLGYILVLDTNNTGKLHIVSADGRKHRTLIEKFENVTDTLDVWVGEDQRTVYVCGGDVIDVYTVVSKE